MLLKIQAHARKIRRDNKIQKITAQKGNRLKLRNARGNSCTFLGPPLTGSLQGH